MFSFVVMNFMSRMMEMASAISASLKSYLMARIWENSRMARSATWYLMPFLAKSFAAFLYWRSSSFKM